MGASRAATIANSHDSVGSEYHISAAYLVFGTEYLILSSPWLFLAVRIDIP